MIKVYVRGIRIEAESIHTIELAPVVGELPAWTPGSHILIHFSSQLKRAYSLCNHLGETKCYRIAVKRESGSRGGSAAVHSLKIGDELIIDAPRNFFEVDNSAERHILLAGGIGITPLYAMFNYLGQTGQARNLHYFVRPEGAIFIGNLGVKDCKLHLGLDHEATQSTLEKIIQVSSADGIDTRYYVCGPVGFLKAAEEAAAKVGLPKGFLRSERFSADPIEVPKKNKNFDHFVVHFSRSGISAEVPVGVSIVSVARANGIDIPTSCEMGVCGACKTKVLSGKAMHCDDYLSDIERELGTVILPCVSRSSSPELCIDR